MMFEMLAGVRPFDGDDMLSIILSKAILLAADSKITDATILRQIRLQVEVDEWY